MALFERLQGCHQVVTTSYTRCDDALGNTGCDGALDNGSDRVHGTNDFGLELRRDMEFNLLEEVFGGTEAADDKDVLESVLVKRTGTSR